MRAVTISDGRLVVAERPDPEPGKGELLVRVAAAGLNRADPPPGLGPSPAPPGSPADIPGLELAGEVAAVGPEVHRFAKGDRGMAVVGGRGGAGGGAAAGPEVHRFAKGDRVMAVGGGGGQAELATVHERLAIPVPDGLAWPE